MAGQKLQICRNSSHGVSSIDSQLLFQENCHIDYTNQSFVTRLIFVINLGYCKGRFRGCNFVTRDKAMAQIGLPLIKPTTCFLVIIIYCCVQHNKCRRVSKYVLNPTTIIASDNDESCVHFFHVASHMQYKSCT